MSIIMSWISFCIFLTFLLVNIIKWGEKLVTKNSESDLTRQGIKRSLRESPLRAIEIIYTEFLIWLIKDF